MYLLENLVTGLEDLIEIEPMRFVSRQLERFRDDESS